ncbi:hypothetical protein [Herpetosiphon giganteus]|uniref:hypothetical protein n=1 Tax=Herpetosiphon giganteus TaxID=2029754 RepID=UPI0019598A64|nr:hypothetical protein [Herpetosiphon giganteus]MBM7845485.1 hypothetical protein [Herpetosiphon giganteus]
MKFAWRRVGTLVGWMIFGMWVAFGYSVVYQNQQRGIASVDFQSYALAAERMQHQANPYPAIAEAQAMWRSVHQWEQRILNAPDPAAKLAVKAQYDQVGQIVGPYLYPPTLAQAVAKLQITSLGMAAILSMATLGFVAFWLYLTKQSSAWTMLVMLSLECMLGIVSGNVEVLLLLGSLLGGYWALYHSRLAAALIIALLLLIKPFYGLFFVALAALAYCNMADSAARQDLIKRIASIAVLALGLIGLEIWRWDSALRHETFNYLANTLEYQWFNFAVAEQSPMSMWNRTVLQGLINLGLNPNSAQILALGLWLLGLVASCWLVWRKQVGFPLLYGLSFLLLYWGRPVGWSFSFLELIVLSLVWPTLGRWGKIGLSTAMLGLIGSRWIALGLTAQAQGMPLNTLQTSTFAWESWLVLPLCLLCLGYAIRQSAHQSLRASTQQILVN